MSATPARIIDAKVPTSGRRPIESIKIPEVGWWAYWLLLRPCWRYPRRASTFWAAVIAGVWSGRLWVAWTVGGLLCVAYVCHWLLGLRSLAVPANLTDLATGAMHSITLRRAWPDLCRAAGISAPRGTDLPRLRRVLPTQGGGVQADVRLGAAVEDLSQSAVLHHAIGCRAVEVTVPKPGWAHLECSWGDRLTRLVQLGDLPPASSGHLVYGLTANGRPASVRWGESILIGGMTRSGKSTCVWSLLAALRREGIPTRLYVSDAKGGIELRALGDVLGRDTGIVRVREYARTPASGELLVKQALSAMNTRFDLMAQRGMRAHVPTPDEPLTVVVIDELLPLQDQLAKGTKSELGRLLYMGAAAGYVVWAGTQDARIEAMGQARDLIPQRICFATPNRAMATAILGDDAVVEGARAWRINTKGVGYSSQDGVRGFERFRCAMVDDVTRLAIASGTFNPAAVDEGPTFLYKWYGYGPPEEDAATRMDERGLYVGISWDAPSRFRQHVANGKSWTSRVTRCEVVEYPTRVEAEEAEKAEIASGRWEANIAHAPRRRPRRLPAQAAS